jgi:hypothetical protein
MIKKLLGFGFGPSVEDKFFDKYNEEQRLMNMRTVYTAGSRPTKPGTQG